MTCIAAGFSRFCTFHRLGIDRLDFHRQQVPELEGVEIPFSVRLDGDPHTIPGLGARDGLHGGGEISNIHPPAQSRRQSHLVHFNRQTCALPPNIRHGLIRRQLEQHQPRTLWATLEIDVLQRRPRGWRIRNRRLRPHSRRSSGRSHGRSPCNRSNGRRRWRFSLYADQHALTVHRAGIPGTLLEVQHNAGPFARNKNLCRLQLFSAEGPPTLW